VGAYKHFVQKTDKKMPPQPRWLDRFLNAGWHDAIMKSDPNDYGELLYRSSARPHRVGEKAPNRWNLYDALGNVWEWTETAFPAPDQQNERSKSADPVLQNQVLCGGAWSFTARVNRVPVRAVRHGGTGVRASVFVAF
jgi:formylglycine-generating enzyme required for sulfatase activity